MKTITVSNLKGGVGKSATAVNLAYELAAYHGKRVLVVDADQNQGATRRLLPPETGRSTVTDIITRPWDSPYGFVYHTAFEGLDIIPADERLAMYGTDAFNGGDCDRYALRDVCVAFAADDAYDYAIVDSAPGMAAPMVCTVMAADEIIIPMTLDCDGLDGAMDLMTQLDGVRKVRPDVRIAGCLVTMLQKDPHTEKDLNALRASAPVPIFDTTIRWSKVVRRASRVRGPFRAVSPRCAPALDYAAFAVEYLGKEGA